MEEYERQYGPMDKEMEERIEAMIDELLGPRVREILRNDDPL